MENAIGSLGGLLYECVKKELRKGGIGNNMFQLYRCCVYVE